MTASSKALRRIGIVDQSSGAWAAGGSYTKMLMHSLANACRGTGVELYLISPQDKANSLRDELAIGVISLASHDYFPGEKNVRHALGLPDKSSAFRGEARLRNLLKIRDKSDIFSVAAANKIDVLLPLFDLPTWGAAIRTIGWVPDFQHVYLPEYFSDAERQRRDASLRRLAERATLLMLSSQSALEHFKELIPAQAHKARVLPFPSLFAFESLNEADPRSSVRKFNLEDKFILVANQFWAHKNHRVVIDALRQLNARGLRVAVVMTGLPADYRDPSNQNFSRLLQAIAEAKLSGQVTLLGQVPFTDLTNLIRTAALVLQPSRFEGWSTIVEDAKALGRPLICSDIAVHREQAPHALGFFDCDDAEALAEQLAAHWEHLAPGPDSAAEAQALAAEQEFARLHGESLLGICHEAYST